MADNLMNYYMNYKTNRLKKYGLVIMHSEDEFLKETFANYLKTYINCYYYSIFDAVYSNTCDDDIIKLELDGKRLEMLDDLSTYELIDSNEVFAIKLAYINEAYYVTLFLTSLDQMRVDNKEDISTTLEQLLKSNPKIKEKLGTKVSNLETLLKETYNTLNKFFKNTDNYYLLDYQLYKDQENLVKIVLTSSITMLQDNYKSSLLERVYREDKLKKDKEDLLIRKFIKQLIFDVYNGRKIYDKYFIELDDYLFTNKKDIENFLEMLNNPFIKRYLVLGISNNNYISCQSIFKKYNYSLACIQDFSHINDVSNKLNNIDTGNVYDYVIVSSYKTKDLNDIMKYTCINLKGILFDKEG